MRRRSPEAAPPKTSDSGPGLAYHSRFVGREFELEAIARVLSRPGAVVVQGASGAGKTRLAQELLHSEALAGLHAAYVRCLPGERGALLLARIERRLGSIPSEDQLVVIDDIDTLPAPDVAELLRLWLRPESKGRFLFLSEQALAMPRGIALPTTFEIEGLPPQDAAAFWAHLEESYGPMPAGLIEQAVVRSRGLPIGLRREYARGAFGAEAWQPASVGANIRRALECLAVLRTPVSPATLVAMANDLEPELESILIDLSARQMIDPEEDGRFRMHDGVRGLVLEQMDTATRRKLESRAAELALGKAPGAPGFSVADEYSLGIADFADAAREALHHSLEAGEPEKAAEQLIEVAPELLRRGAGRELAWMIDQVRGRAPTRTRELLTIQAALAIRDGRVSDALALGVEADVIEQAHLRWRSGDVASAAEALERVRRYGGDAELEMRARALLAEIEVDRGNYAAAEALVAAPDALTEVSAIGRAALQMSAALVDRRAGRLTAARVALTRANSDFIDPLTSARIDVRRALCLALEGRVGEAEKLRHAAEQVARDQAATAVVIEAEECRTILLAMAGELADAQARFTALVERMRAAGDEVGAVRLEIEQAFWLTESGQLSQAATLVTAAQNQCLTYGLHGLVARARLIIATVDLLQYRGDEAAQALRELVASEAADGATRNAAIALLAATTGEPVNAALEGGTDDRVELLRVLREAGAEPSTGLARVGRLVAGAERCGKRAQLARALALISRLQVSYGERKAGRASALRALGEAEAAGAIDARVQALLTLSALAREGEDPIQARKFADDAQELSNQSGLSVESLIAGRARELCDAVGSPMPLEETAQAATMSMQAVKVASRWLTDLGLTVVRPYRVVAADGSEKRVADASPELLQLAQRELVVDGLRELILRSGSPIADLRRRSLLKRLLFLFAARPGAIFSKEQIVEAVWQVDYHPLRHDAALFTNIMRIRRLLGQDGTDLIRVSDDGYRFHPPKDFLFVERVEE